MKNTMRYKGYLARIEYDERDGLLAGEVIGLSEKIGFDGVSVDELRGNFEFAIDHYLSACRAAGISPERQAGGRVLLRLDADVHASALVAAQSSGRSLNDWLRDAVAQALSSAQP
jgi:predicted HicB family RNase H-like nuclease